VEGAYTSFLIRGSSYILSTSAPVFKSFELIVPLAYSYKLSKSKFTVVNIYCPPLSSFKAVRFFHFLTFRLLSIRMLSIITNFLTLEILTFTLTKPKIIILINSFHIWTLLTQLILCLFLFIAVTHSEPHHHCYKLHTLSIICHLLASSSDHFPILFKLNILTPLIQVSLAP
jgi:hypothetical protein